MDRFQNVPSSGCRTEQNRSKLFRLDISNIRFYKSLANLTIFIYLASPEKDEELDLPEQEESIYGNVCVGNRLVGKPPHQH